MNCPQCGNNCSEQCDNLTIPTGQDGQDGETAYVAYADDDQGNGFSTTNSSKDYIAVTQAPAGQTNNQSLHSGNWHFWGGSSSSYSGGILYNDDTNVGTSNPSFTMLTGKGYTVPSGTIDTDGDALRIKAAFSKEAGVDIAEVKIHIYNTNNPSANYTQKLDQFQIGVEEPQGVLNIQLNRISNTEASAYTTFGSISTSYEAVTDIRFYDDSTVFQTSPDFDNDDLEIEVLARSVNGSVNINCDHVSVELIEKT